MISFGKLESTTMNLFVNLIIKYFSDEMDSDINKGFLFSDSVL